jgi:hypothetical protein
MKLVTSAEERHFKMVKIVRFGTTEARSVRAASWTGVQVNAASQ